MLKRLVLGLWFGSCAAWSVPVVVDQTTTDFQFVFTNATGVPGSGGTGVGAFVMGPDTPPAGSGSVNFQLPDGDHSVGLQTSLFSGTLLSDITSFSYSTYITAWGGPETPESEFGYSLSNMDLWEENQYTVRNSRTALSVSRSRVASPFVTSPVNSASRRSPSPNGGAPLVCPRREEMQTLFARHEGRSTTSNGSSKLLKRRSAWLKWSEKS